MMPRFGLRDSIRHSYAGSATDIEERNRRYSEFDALPKDKPVSELYALLTADQQREVRHMTENPSVHFIEHDPATGIESRPFLEAALEVLATLERGEFVGGAEEWD